MLGYFLRHLSKHNYSTNFWKYSIGESFLSVPSAFWNPAKALNFDFLTCAESQSDHMIPENRRDQVTAWNGFGQSVLTKGSGVEPFSDAAPSRGKHSLRKAAARAARRRGRRRCRMIAPSVIFKAAEWPVNWAKDTRRTRRTTMCTTHYLCNTRLCVSPLAKSICAECLCSNPSNRSKHST